MDLRMFFLIDIHAGFAASCSLLFEVSPPVTAADGDLLSISTASISSSATRAKASTSEMALTVRVDDGRLAVGRGSRAHVRSSSPQKSPGPIRQELKNPVRPPLVV
ncbi:unnamed protein product [Spirodela intermedia]|uniref:Uncharacterized protein n=1 Tax=Spirodela intermedia TaxID=51605 RepID=A0A7I8KM36_SPIIN|nr:unnamed protein product [Spirodela intermedia]